MGKREKISGEDRQIKRETKNAIVAIAFFALAILFIFSIFGKSGVVGRYLYRFLDNLLGVGYFLLPIACFMISVSFWKNFEPRRFLVSKVIGSLLFFLSSLGLIDIVVGKGGSLGRLIALPLLKLFEVYASIIILGAVLISALLFVFETRLTFEPIFLIWQKISKRKRNRLKINTGAQNDGQEDDDEPDGTVVEEEELEETAAETTENQNEKIKIAAEQEKNSDEEIMAGKTEAALFRWIGMTYSPPPISLLERDRGKPIVGDIKANANIIKRTLQNFGISVEMDEVSIGPSVTRYSMKPAEGVKLSKIVALQDNLAYALAAHPIRIEAPIPGKSLVGLELPNNTKSTVGLASMLASEDYQKNDRPLLVSLGKGITGKSQFGNLGKMPHLLIAGATGSGKSVAIHTIINSLIFRNSPTLLRFIMIDPKRVELTLYNKIPHLLTPVITDPKKAILSLKWAAKEMERRYNILESKSVRDIESYHKNILEPALKKLREKNAENPDIEIGDEPDLMPYIVIIIDELADIMSTYPRELEASIVRLAQMSRAVGIHLILSTQRPSVNIITGLIKANIPARIALQVSSQIDSRTILDTGGAEKLLGAGDLLYLGSDMAKPQRLQSAYVSETEVKKVVKYLRETYADEIPSELTLTTDDQNADGGNILGLGLGDDEEVDDDLYETAREEVLKVGRASTSYIQRKLRVGYSRAARLMDMLEERGVIGPADGSKARTVTIQEPPPESADGATV
jgi:S-DNA-T family DNA segregation ATPase FtsK/SpoIIIE